MLVLPALALLPLLAGLFLAPNWFDDRYMSRGLVVPSAHVDVVVGSDEAVQAALDQWTDGRPPAYADAGAGDVSFAAVRLHVVPTSQAEQPLTLYAIDKRSNRLTDVWGATWRGSSEPSANDSGNQNEVIIGLGPRDLQVADRFAWLSPIRKGLADHADINIPGDSVRIGRSAREPLVVLVALRRARPMVDPDDLLLGLAGSEEDGSPQWAMRLNG